MGFFIFSEELDLKRSCAAAAEDSKVKPLAWFGQSGLVPLWSAFGFPAPGRVNPRGLFFD
jgi:hypothetical protein